MTSDTTVGGMMSPPQRRHTLLSTRPHAPAHSTHTENTHARALIPAHDTHEPFRPIHRCSVWATPAPIVFHGHTTSSVHAIECLFGGLLQRSTLFSLNKSHEFRSDNDPKTLLAGLGLDMRNAR